MKKVSDMENVVISQWQRMKGNLVGVYPITWGRKERREEQAVH